MLFNTQHILRKKFLSILIANTIILSSFLPIFVERAEAQFGGIVFDPTVNAAIVAQTGLQWADMAARAAAQAVLQRMINSTVRWAQSGFDGNPAYVTDPKQYFTDLADGIAGEFIAASSSPINFLCSPFQAQIRLALRQQYLYEQPFQCTLSGVVGNLEAFYGDFNQGGWDTWFATTQNAGNNPYGAYLGAQIALDSRIAKAVGLKNDELNKNQGFLSVRTCLERDELGKCKPGKEGPVKTPGSVIHEQLNKVLPANMERFIGAQHLEDLIEAFVSGALNRYVFGPQGLFSGGSPPSTVNPNSNNTPAGISTPPPRPTYNQCVESCIAAAENGIDTDSCIAVSCSLLQQQ